MEWPLVTDLQILPKDRGCQSQYLDTVKKHITELYKLNSGDPSACARRVEYRLEEYRVICPPGRYEVSFSHLSGLFLMALRQNQSYAVGRQSLLDSEDRRFRARYLHTLTPARA